jgi:hypothetical protein
MDYGHEDFPFSLSARLETILTPYSFFYCFVDTWVELKACSIVVLLSNTSCERSVAFDGQKMSHGEIVQPGNCGFWNCHLHADCNFKVISWIIA